MTYMYSIMFIFLSGSQANALVFGASVLGASTPDGTEVDYRLQKFFAILLVGTVCQLQALSRINYIRFSNVFAIYKVAFLSVLTIIGWCALRNQRAPAAAASNDPYGTMNFRNSFKGTTTHPYAIALAMLDIMRVYSGYENANFVGVSKSAKVIWRTQVLI
jgi:amino acid transporter